MTHITEWVPGDKDTGWIDPEGIVHILDYYEHLKFFENHPTMGDLYQQFQNQLEHNQEEIEQAMFDLEPDEHPAMHRFACIDDEARNTLYWEAYSRGWIRIGVLTHNYKKAKHFKIEIYGVEEAVNKWKRVWRELGAGLDAHIAAFYITKSTEWPFYQVYKAKRTVLCDPKKGIGL